MPKNSFAADAVPLDPTLGELLLIPKISYSWWLGRCLIAAHSSRTPLLLSAFGFEPLWTSVSDYTYGCELSLCNFYLCQCERSKHWRRLRDWLFCLSFHCSLILCRGLTWWLIMAMTSLHQHHCSNAVCYFSPLLQRSSSSFSLPLL